MIDYQQWRSLLEIDREAGQIKGSAFHSFKQLGATLTETQDYIVLHHQQDAAAIANLRATGRIYRNSVNVILLSTGAAQRLLDTFKTSAAGLSNPASKVDY
ncbi:MAG: hypothetical protein ACRETM_02800 [Stenotrophobium sp.]